MQSRSYAEYDALRDPARDYELPGDVAIADWKDHVSDVLFAIDGLLEPNGLEVVMFDTQSDTYAFKIEPRKGRGAHVSIDEVRGILKQETGS